MAPLSIYCALSSAPPQRRTTAAGSSAMTKSPVRCRAPRPSRPRRNCRSSIWLNRAARMRQHVNGRCSIACHCDSRRYFPAKAPPARPLSSCSSVSRTSPAGIGSAVPEPGPAIYYGAEDDSDELHRRLTAITEHYGVKFSDLITGGLHLLSFAGADAVLAIPDARARCSRRRCRSAARGGRRYQAQAHRHRCHR